MTDKEYQIMTDGLRTTVVYLALVIGTTLAITSLCVWVLRGDFGVGGAAFLGTGCVLVGLSVFTRASIEAGPIKANFESEASKRFASISTTSLEIEKAVRQSIVPPDIADKVLAEVRSKAFLTVDTRPYLNERGRVVHVPYSDFESIGLFLRYAWFLMEDQLPVHSYNVKWLIQDLESQHYFRNIGSRYAREVLGTKWDDRPLSEVGILPGMVIGIVPMPAS